MNALKRAAASAVPMPIRQLPYRVSWMRGTPAFRRRPLATAYRLAAWTLAECWRDELSFEDGGMSFRTTPNNFCGLWSAVAGAYETELLAFVERSLRRGQCFVDVGSNIGLYSARASRAVGPGGRVVAYEAHPVTASLFQKNMVLNGIRNVTFCNAAVGEDAGELRMRYEKGNSGSTHVATADGASDVRVPVVRLDESLSGLSATKVDYLKIDVEGFEPFVLRGARRTIEENHGIIVQTEVDARHLARYGSNPAEVFTIMRGMGLRPHTLIDGGRLEACEDVDYGDVIWRR